MKIIDISMDIHPGMPVFRNNPEKQPRIEVLREFDQGAHESRIILELHTGTHIDAPLHMVQGGETTDIFSVNNMVVPCRVIDLTEVTDRIMVEDLEKHDIQPGEFILLKTRNSFVDVFEDNFVFLEKGGAHYLADIGILGVGTDALGIERSQADHSTHKTLLAKKILILEGLRLKDVTPGKYTLVAAPLKINQVEASPVRALLLSE